MTSVISISVQSFIQIFATDINRMDTGKPFLKKACISLGKIHTLDLLSSNLHAFLFHTSLFLHISDGISPGFSGTKPPKDGDVNHQNVTGPCSKEMIEQQRDFVLNLDPGGINAISINGAFSIFSFDDFLILFTYNT